MKYKFPHVKKKFVSGDGDKQFPLFLIILALLLSILIISWFCWNFYKEAYKTELIDKKTLKMVELRNQIIYYDEVLTMAARMAAVTGDLKWEQHYRSNEIKLNRTIAEAEKEESNQISQINLVNSNLIRMEKQAFDAVRRGRKNEAQTLLFGDDYKKQKQLYTDGLKSLNKKIEQHRNYAGNAAEEKFLFSIFVAFIALLLSILVWLFTIKRLNKSRKKLLDNIAEKEKTENSLRESEALYRVITESASDAIITIDESHKILFVNSAAEQIFGFKQDEMIGNDMSMLMPEDMSKFHTAGMQRYLETGVRKISWSGVEVPARHKSGRVFPIEISFGETIRDDKRIFTAILRDITERKRTAEVAENARKYQNLFEYANDAILIIEVENEIVLNANEKACELYGYSKEEFIGHSMQLNSQDLGNGKKHIKKLLKHGEFEKFETIQFKSDGTPINLLVNASLIEYEDKKAILSINRDITDREATKNELFESQQMLQLVMDTLPHAIWWKDKNLKYLGANRILAELAGYKSGKELIGLSDYDMPWTREESKFFRKCDRRVLESGVGEFNIIEPQLQASGRQAWLDTNKVPLRNSKGEIIGVLGTFEDITEQKQAEYVIRESEKRYRMLGEGIMHQVWTALPDGKLDYVNGQAGKYFGLSTDELLGEEWLKLIHPEDVPECLEKWKNSLETGETYEVEFRLKRADGEYLWHLGRASAGLDENGNIIKWFGTNTDIDVQRRTTAALIESEIKLRTLFDNMNEGLLQVDNAEVIKFVNNRFCKMTGYTEKELIGKTTFEILLSDEESVKFIREANRQRANGKSSQYELRLRKKNGEILWTIVGSSPVYGCDNEIIGSMGVLTDITDLKNAEEQLLHDAFHDSLTGLANRELFNNHLQILIDRSSRGTVCNFAVLFLDFDRFKVINDSLGHNEGDKLLKLVAERLERVIRPGDLLARLGGDEFTILISDIEDRENVLVVAERIQESLKNSFYLAERDIFISASIGIAFSSSSYDKAEEILRDADIAMYHAKAKGKAQYQVFDDQMHKHALTQLQFETQMREALDKNEFIVCYQPIINLRDEKLIGFEALIRWDHPERGIIPPLKFIPLAEENGLIVSIGEWVLRESCRQLREWQLSMPEFSDLSVSVNLSGKQFTQPNLYEKISQIIVDTGLPPETLKLEITESSLMENSETVSNTMRNLKTLGVQFSLDDFGTGYSSLSYLHNLPVSYLKIDRSFVGRMLENEENGQIIRTIIELAQNVKMQVVAEGIETAEDLGFLKKLSCEHGQGFYFSKPLRAKDAETFIKTFKSNFIPNDFDNLEITGLTQ